MRHPATGTTHRSGFTLIELLVVVAIIGLLASIVLASLNGARIKSRDVRRLADLKEIQNALELYYSSHNAYPITSAGCGGVWTSFDSPTYASVLLCDDGSGQKTLTNILAPYIAGEADPRSLGGDSGYLYRGDGANYCLMAYRTPEDLRDFSAAFVNPNRCGSGTATAQCSAAGTSGATVNAIYIGVGTFAVTGC